MTSEVLNGASEVFFLSSNHFGSVVEKNKSRLYSDSEGRAALPKQKNKGEILYEQLNRYLQVI